jgi:hypothetical protein
MDILHRSRIDAVIIIGNMEVFTGKIEVFYTKVERWQPHSAMLLPLLRKLSILLLVIFC